MISTATLTHNFPTLWARQMPVSSFVGVFALVDPLPSNSATDGYTPSLALSILGVVLFVMAFAAHCLLLFRHRTWYFSTVVLGTLMEIAGYVFRTLSSQKDPYSIVYFVVQYFMIVVAPVFFSAAIYTLITVMIKRIGRKYTLLPPQAILWIFIVCDVVATIVQIAGAALIGTAYSKNKDPTIPNRILLAGLVFQVVSFAIFISCLCLFVWKSRKATSSFFKSSAGAVFIATLAVYLRTCFRLAETAQGLLHYLSTHEVCDPSTKKLLYANKVAGLLWVSRVLANRCCSVHLHILASRKMARNEDRSIESFAISFDSMRISGRASISL